MDKVMHDDIIQSLSNILTGKNPLFLGFGSKKCHKVPKSIIFLPNM
jgi:hypothetical protein